MTMDNPPETKNIKLFVGSSETICYTPPVYVVKI